MKTIKGRAEKLNNYEGFVDKFRPAKTTDDCYTPQIVYDAVMKWVNDNIFSLDAVNVVRPFYPGGDYEHFDYPQECLVLDNPPFSILARICRFYHSKGIKYFLFAPTLTMFSSAKELDRTFIVAAASVTYENGAVVNTSFVTNLPCDNTRVWCAGGLCKEIEKADALNKKSQRTTLPVYEYPSTVINAALLQKIVQRGIDFKIPKPECAIISRLDAQLKQGKAIYGGGFLISERLAAERLAAERLAAERLATREKQVWTLSDKELKIIDSLNTSPYNATD